MGIERRRARAQSHAGGDDGGDSDIELDENPEAAHLFSSNESENVSAPLFGHARLIHGRGDDAGMAHLAGTPKPAIPVYVTIHRIRRLVVAAIDDPYTVDQLRAPRMDMQVVRPLADRLYSPDDPSIVYCLLANRVQFLRSQSDSASIYQSVNIARANLCELVATRVLRRFHEDHPDRPGLLLLANVLVSGFDPFDSAPQVVQRGASSNSSSGTSPRPTWTAGQERDGTERKLTALELAILSESKILIGSLACQRVVNAVYRGMVVYTPMSFIDIIPDHYKQHPVSLYEPRRANILNHRRLIVPQLRNLIELFHFLILLLLYIGTMVHRHPSSSSSEVYSNPHTHVSIYEAAFAIYTTGWVLEQFAAIIEHGWEVHAQNLWSFLDVTFIFIFIIYGLVRISEILLLPPSPTTEYYALPILCIAAPILLTRIAFNLMPDNIVFIALHAMMRDFTRLTFIAIWCFTGFLLGLLWLMRTNTSMLDLPDAAFDNDASPTLFTIAKWLLWIWFGLDGTGIEATAKFHNILGPSLAVTFAFLGNTLFLTILVAILTNTFSKIIANETAEIQFRRAVLTFQGVKSDSIFAYPPPFNILALVTMLPLKVFVFGPAQFHRFNVAAIRAINCPVLLMIALYERRRVWARGLLGGGVGDEEDEDGYGNGRGWRRHFGLNPYGDIQAVFRAEPPADVLALLEKLDGEGEIVRTGSRGGFGGGGAGNGSFGAGSGSFGGAGFGGGGFD
ncbi:hypothetical protein QBC37DRAFT_442887 [Rhypophila decipiens]|uniref:Calcium channel YVC1 n=1 Tax=Rhypophila decipiens TaxID=261697 RepID=A0AAN6Y071_9PEZI|nr:hypothetical protein QBC37DRAFT_442887 [Rhypophila decipiens]